VPMCQSPRIDEGLLRRRKVPANDNVVSVLTNTDVGPTYRLRVICRKLLAFCCNRPFGEAPLRKR
jgi:hypothetical protein